MQSTRRFTGSGSPVQNPCSFQASAPFDGGDYQNQRKILLYFDLGKPPSAPSPPLQFGLTYICNLHPQLRIIGNLHPQLRIILVILSFCQNSTFIFPEKGITPEPQARGVIPFEGKINVLILTKISE